MRFRSLIFALRMEKNHNIRSRPLEKARSRRTPPCSETLQGGHSFARNEGPLATYKTVGFCPARMHTRRMQTRDQSGQSRAATLRPFTRGLCLGSRLTPRPNSREKKGRPQTTVLSCPSHSLSLSLSLSTPFPLPLPLPLPLPHSLPPSLCLSLSGAR
jgi:hypothetical protein